MKKTLGWIVFILLMLFSCAGMEFCDNYVRQANKTNEHQHNE